ncbi:MAG TPA: hypothetical protein DDW76_37430, partial [Cyanobacteria bacterium UBA11369]|nr:hypothetical protein [Cyanobacteria bacterium UBA11369]
MAAINNSNLNLLQNANSDFGYTNIRSREIVFIDATVPDYQTLIDSAHAGTQVVLLDPSQDGIAQITAALQGGNFSALHIVSHGSEGSIQLGSSILNAQTLETEYAPSLQQWRESLTPDADILFYGCNVAADSNREAEPRYSRSQAQPGNEDLE